MLYYIDVPKSQLPANFTTALINKGMPVHFKGAVE